MKSRGMLFALHIFGALSLFCTPSVATSEVPRSVQRKGTCAVGEVEFHGQCVAQDECCREGLCAPGMVFEFVKEPSCVPCADAKTQSGASYCAAQDMTQADKELNSVYGALLDSFPKKREQLKEAERAWITFRDKFCATYAGIYEGGSVEKEVVGKCKVVETRHQILRINDLRKEWSSTAPSQSGALPGQGGRSHPR